MPAGYGESEALLNANALKRAVVGSASVSCIATDANGVIQLFNVGAERMLGYAAAEVVDTTTPAGFCDPDEVSALAAALTLEFATAVAAGFEALVFRASRGDEGVYTLTQIRKDGSRFPAAVCVTALLDAQDGIVGYLLIGTDNTRTAGAYRDRFFALSPDLLCTLGFDGYFKDLNPSWEGTLGFTLAELLSTPFIEFVHPDDRPATLAAFEKIAGGTRLTVFENRYRCQDGTYRYIQWNATPVVAEQLICGAGIDVTNRKRADQQTANALRALNDVKAALDEHAIVAITDPAGKITYVNDKFCGISKYSRGELLGKRYRMITRGHHPKEFIRKVWQTVRGGRVWRGEIADRAKDGAAYWVDTTVVPYLGADSKPLHYIAIRTDITERKQLEQRLQQKNIALEEANRMKSEFLANMSHELRTPLNSIIGFSEVLRDGLIGSMTDQQRGFIGDIFSSGNHLLSLINDILDLSKVEAGKMTLDLEPVQASSLLANSLSIVRELAAARQIRLEIHMDEDLGWIQADPRRFKQIAYNLLSNAVKFSEDGGRVILTGSRVQRADVGTLSGEGTGRSFPLSDSTFTEFLKLSVTDSGIGISDEGLGGLFTPFSQVDSGLARKFEGTGLGLAMVKLLAELHGGAVAVDSVLGKGSCFTVWLPLRAAEDGASALPGMSAGHDGEAVRGQRVALVVDDDVKAADVIRLQLEAEGFTVLHAASAEVALVLARQQPVSLITLDMLLPNMDGWEFLGRLKQLPELRRIPVVIISIVADRNKGFALGAAAVMQKPISRQDLYASLVDLGLFPVGQGSTLKILIVDDDPRAVELVAVRVLALGSRVLRAHGGREAINIARQERPDLIVLDLMMPEVNGFDVVEALKERPDTARIPILVVTAKQITADDRAKLNGYVTMIMEKTEFDPDGFTSEVRRAMHGRERVA